MIELLSLFFDVFQVIFYFDLLLPALERVRVEKFAVESSDLLCILEELVIGDGKLFFLVLGLEDSFLFIDFAALELLLLELPKALLLFPFLEVFRVVDPLVRSLLALHMLVPCQIVLSFYEI